MDKPLPDKVLLSYGSAKCFFKAIFSRAIFSKGYSFKGLKSLGIFLIFLLLPFLCFAQFPYNETFKNSTFKLNDVVVGGDKAAFLTAGPNPAGGAAIDANGSGYLRLTDNTGNQKAFIYSNNVFPGTYGLNISFEYYTYGGNGADGICFFLFDAAITDATFNIGGFGGSLGYAQINGGPGVSKGYLGIGLDEFGNFSDPSEDRQGGTVRTENSVTLRGAGDGNAAVTGNYQFLTTAQTTALSPSFGIAGESRTATSPSSGYRKAFISLTPGSSGGLIINVSIQHDAVTPPTPVITNYFYNKTIPASGLKYGISSSTGGNNNYHEIRGLSIAVNPNALVQPTAMPDVMSGCQGQQQSIDILSNDTRPNANGAPNPLNVNLNPPASPTINDTKKQDITIAGMGEFKFLPNSADPSLSAQILTFIPEPGFNGTASIKYNFMDIYGALSTTTTATFNTVFPKITTQPQSNTVCEGSDFTTSVGITTDANTGNLSYQWQYLSDPTAGTWTPINGATASMLTVPSVTTDISGRQYRVLVTSSTGSCSAVSNTATLTVNPKVTISLTSATSTANQTVCINHPIQSIIYTVANETGVTVSGLPAGLRGDYAPATHEFTISGTPTVSGPFSYTVAATGLCVPASSVGTVTVNPDVTIALTSVTSTAGQTVCINQPIQSIIYTVANETGVTVSGLPAGLRGDYAPATHEFTISGTPTVSGPFSYTVAATGLCVPASSVGTVTVNPDVTIALTSVTSTAGQTVCINQPIQSIIYTVANETGVTVSGLPAGLRGDYAPATHEFTISGTPTVSGPFSYTVAATGLCVPASSVGTVTVNPDVTIALTSATSTAGQTVCINQPIQSIIYTVANETGVTVSGLPAGLRGDYAPATHEFTISGTPTVSGAFSYTVSATGLCSPASSGGTITVNPNTNLQLTSGAGTANQSLCVNTELTPITYQTTNATTASVSGLPQGVTGQLTNGIFTISGTSSEPGTYTYIVTASGTCTTTQLTGTITVYPHPIGFNDVINTLTCGSTSFNYNLQDNINNTGQGGNSIPATFTWTVTPNNNILGMEGGSGNTISATLTNTSHTIQPATYTITPTSVLGGCPGQPFTLVVTVPVCSGISITKTADVSVVSKVGDKIRYTITVKNTASANHTHVQVTDPFLGGLLTGPISGDNGNGILEADESWVYTGTYTVTQADLDNNGKPAAGTGTIINTATVTTAEQANPETASATVNIVTTGSIALVKTGVISKDFSTITYTFILTNTGNVRLHNLDLEDLKTGGKVTLSADAIDVGASITATVTYTVSDQEKRDGLVTNTATITGTTPAGDVVTDISGTQQDNDTPTVVNIDDKPVAVNDHADTKIDQPVTFTITGNDIPSFNGLDAGSVVITRYPLHGQVQVFPDGTVTYTPDKGFAGPDDFTYTVTDLKGKVSNKALVSINVSLIDLFIPNTFTPNGDGKNDTFQIIGIEDFDSVSMVIVNRWGNEVYVNKNYLNQWDGSGLSEGTYYYIIVFKKGATQTVKKGWILLKR
ncbi:gliding motility-associated C-terminal domain-containing protein [Pedobacter sp. L105]|uniref:DUF7507 domain-containing protein n=1 Tax=Pedobacter sp. L105 TaxID=1641871 RepID=UPI0020B11116|nr:gliding motility-associated C-terminal domain-containing protein [Pedobacter sp. L105]